MNEKFYFWLQEEERGWSMVTRGRGNQAEKVENEVSCPATSSSKKEVQSRR